MRGLSKTIVHDKSVPQFGARQPERTHPWNPGQIIEITLDVGELPPAIVSLLGDAETTIRDVRPR